MTDDDRRWVQATFGELAARSRARLAAALAETDKDIEATANAVYSKLTEKNADILATAALAQQPDAEEPEP